MLLVLTARDGACKSRACAPKGSALSLQKAGLYSHCAFGFSSPNDSHTCWTPWSVFQDGSGGSPIMTAPQIGQATAPARGRSEERAPEWDRRRASQDTGGSPSAGGRFRPPRPSTAPQRVAATYWGGSTPVGACETRTGPCGPRLPACRRPPGGIPPFDLRGSTRLPLDGFTHS